MNVPATAVLPQPDLFLFSAVARTQSIHADRRTLAGALLLHAAALLLVFLGVHAVQTVVPQKLHPAELSLVAPPPAPAILRKRPAEVGGGGGQAGPAPVTRGNPPQFAAEPLSSPKALPVEEPQRAVAPVVEVQKDLRMATVDAPNFGMANSPLAGISPGNGRGGGLGSGSGEGIGPGSGGNMGGGLKRIGGGVSAPEVLFEPQPEFSEEARKAKLSGNVLVYLQVDTLGRPQHVRVLRGIGLGLDEKALAAVRQYRFKPAMEGGHAVAVEMNIEVGFQIF